MDQNLSNSNSNENPNQNPNLFNNFNESIINPNNQNSLYILNNPNQNNNNLSNINNNSNHSSLINNTIEDSNILNVSINNMNNNNINTVIFEKNTKSLNNSLSNLTNKENSEKILDNSEISNLLKILNKSNNEKLFEKQENKIYRCKKCSLIPMLENFYQGDKLFISYKCENKHYDYEEFNEFYKRNKIGFKITHSSDFTCQKHNKNFVFYCDNCHLNLCQICLENHKFHKYLNLNYLNDNEIELYIKNISKAEENLKDFLIKCKKILDELDIYFLNIHEIYNHFSEINYKQINYTKDLLKIYENFKNENKINYQILFNIKNSIIFNQLDTNIDENFNLFTKVQKIFSIINCENNYLLKKSEIDINYDSDITDNEIKYLSKLNPLKDNIKVKFRKIDGIGNVYNGEIKNNSKEIKHGRGLLIIKHSGKYLGYVEENKKSIYGYLFSYNFTYRGQFKDDLREGFGIEKYNNGEIYKGYYSKNLFNGFGILNSINGDIFIGEYKNRIKEGFGINYFMNGDKYIGEYKEGVQNGFGIKFNGNGGKFIGNFLNNYYIFGREESKIKEKYIGEFKGFEKEGLGIYYHLNGFKFYQGEFKSNKFNGYGILFHPNGNILAHCTFKNNLQEGLGFFFHENKKKFYFGNLKEDERDGFGVNYKRNGDIEIGFWKKEILEGLEIIKKNNGEIWYGIVKDEEFNGFVIIKYPNGSRYEGEIKNNLKHGFGIMYDLYGNFNIGVWNHDQLFE